MRTVRLAYLNPRGQTLTSSDWPRRTKAHPSVQSQTMPPSIPAQFHSQKLSCSIKPSARSRSRMGSNKTFFVSRGPPGVAARISSA